MKIRSVGVELFRAGVRAEEKTSRRTDMAKIIVDFRNFANVLNKDFFFTVWQLSLLRDNEYFSYVTKLENHSCRFL
jgi:hypothetical protein